MEIHQKLQIRIRKVILNLTFNPRCLLVMLQLIPLVSLYISVLDLHLGQNVEISWRSLCRSNFFVAVDMSEQMTTSTSSISRASSVTDLMQEDLEEDLSDPILFHIDCICIKLADIND